MEQSIFGKVIKSPPIDWELIKEFRDHRDDIFVPAGQGKGGVGGDPNFWYLWPLKNDPAARQKIARGLYIPVSTEDEPELDTPADSNSGYYELNEHVLCKMPVDMYRNYQASLEYDAMQRERRLEQDHMATISEASGQSLEGIYETKEQTKRALV